MSNVRDLGSMAKGKSGGLGETVRTVIYAVLIALGIRTVAFEPFNIPTGSMIPTLLVGDYLFVSKYSYGYSHKTLLFGLPLFEGRILGSPPERGDVAVFMLPTDESKDYIKRVIGLPGDEIQMRGGVLHINGEPVQREFVGEVQSECAGQVGTYQQYIETLPNGVSHIVLERSDREPLDDNRDCSTDSRVLMAVGFVPEENLVGRAEIRWFSLENASFWEIWKWPTALRFDRLFTAIR
jgi:signal peptidase I